MNLSISNIAWSSENDQEMYGFLAEMGFKGLEIAPTRLFPEQPYDHLDEAQAFSQHLKKEFGLSISSMQSIWYGISQAIFSDDEQRAILIAYTKKAVDFAVAIGCPNLVFGSPKNRTIGSKEDLPIAKAFFKTIGDYAAEKGTVIALEPNPPYYNTNFINTTEQAFAFVCEVDSPGLKVNVDLGTSIHYNDPIVLLQDHIDLINHIHLSEPMLKPIEQRTYHHELKTLSYAGFDGYVSIEMANPGDLSLVKQTIGYAKEVLG